MAKQIDARVVHKHDTETNWAKATNFVPKSAELIIYDADDTHTEPRMKIGDGVNKVGALEFLYDSLTNDDIDSVCV